MWHIYNPPIGSIYHLYTTYIYIAFWGFQIFVWGEIYQNPPGDGGTNVIEAIVKQQFQQKSWGDSPSSNKIVAGIFFMKAFGIRPGNTSKPMNSLLGEENVNTITPHKSNIDTKNCHFKGITFSKPSFWVSMLVFGSLKTFAALDFATV